MGWARRTSTRPSSVTSWARAQGAVSAATTSRIARHAARCDWSACSCIGIGSVALFDDSHLTGPRANLAEDCKRLATEPRDPTLPVRVEGLSARCGELPWVTTCGEEASRHMVR